MPVLSWVIVIIAFIGTLFIGLFTLFKNPKYATNQWFTLFSFLFAIYLIINQLSVIQTDSAAALFWIRLIMTIAPAIVFTFFVLVFVFPRRFLRISPLVIIPLFIATLLLMTLGLTPLIFSDVIISGGQIVPVPGAAIGLFILYNFFLLGTSTLILIKKLHQASGIEKMQLRFFLIGTVTTFTLILLTNVVFVIFFKFTSLVPLLPIYIFIFNAAISYAIVRHRLLDIRLLVARTVSYTVLVVLIAAVFSSVLILGSQYFFDEPLTQTQTLTLVLLSVVIALSFHSLRRLFEQYTDRFLFKNRYSTNNVLGSLSKIMASELYLEDVAHGVLRELKEQLRITKLAFILLEGNLIADMKSEGFKESPTLDEHEIVMLSEMRNTVIFDELEDGRLKEIMRKLDLSVIAHLRTEGEQVGLLALGAKESGDIYFKQDLNLIEILAPEAAVAIQNAKAYEEIKRFSVTLQEEVNRATKDLQIANEKLRELDKLKDEFISLASHELRTPLSSLKVSLSTILDGYTGELPAKTREFLTAGYNENDRLIRLVNNLLNISRIQAGRFTFTIAAVDLNTMIAEVVETLQLQAKEKNIYLRFDKLNNLPQVSADRDKLREVIINLIGNSMKFTDKGGITVRTGQKDGMVQVSVIDTGPGIPLEDQERLFRRFAQAGQPNQKQAMGTGLGLYISKKILDGLGGKIWFTSPAFAKDVSVEGGELGKGAVFYFSVPIASGK